MTEVSSPGPGKACTGLMRVVRFSPVDSIAFLGLSNDDVKTIGAAATAVGVLFALLGTNLRARLRRPKLLLVYAAQRRRHIGITSNCPLETATPGASGYDCASRTRADVILRRTWRILVTSYRGGGPLGLDPRPLIWSGQKDWKRPDEPPVVSLSLPRTCIDTSISSGSAARPRTTTIRRASAYIPAREAARTPLRPPGHAHYVRRDG